MALFPSPFLVTRLVGFFFAVPGRMERLFQSTSSSLRLYVDDVMISLLSSSPRLIDAIIKKINKY